jgi:hypothetical protein
MASFLILLRNYRALARSKAVSRFSFFRIAQSLPKSRVKSFTFDCGVSGGCGQKERQT